jgi:anti-sigma regulatory factor (Ser/Thr protein kinase)
VRLAGWLDIDVMPRVRDAVLSCLAMEPDLVIVDVAGITDVTPESLVDFAALAHEATVWPGSTIAFASVSPPLADALSRAGAPIPAYPTVTAARDSAEPDRPRRRYRQTLPASPVAAPVARRLLERACESWSIPQIRDAAELVATELVTNAVRHAGTVVLTVSLRPPFLQISVADDSRSPPDVRGANLYDEHGRGLLMIDALSSDWGATYLAGGKVVWAKILVQAGSPY